MSAQAGCAPALVWARDFEGTLDPADKHEHLFCCLFIALFLRDLDSALIGRECLGGLPGIGKRFPVQLPRGGIFRGMFERPREVCASGLCVARLEKLVAEGKSQQRIVLAGGEQLF